MTDFSKHFENIDHLLAELSFDPEQSDIARNAFANLRTSFAMTGSDIELNFQDMKIELERLQGQCNALLTDNYELGARIESLQEELRLTRDEVKYMATENVGSW